MELEGRLAPVERRGDVVARQLEQRRALERRVAAARERFFEPGADVGRGEILVRGGDDERRARQDSQNLGHALARLLDRDRAGGNVAAIRDAVARGGDLGVELGGGLTGAHGLHVDAGFVS